jgi:hypothetical protein
MTDLAQLSDDTLLTAVKRLTGTSNELTAQLLAHLGEVEARGIHRNMACATLYTYCVYELRMSEDEAHRRCRAARTNQDTPRAALMNVSMSTGTMPTRSKATRRSPRCTLCLNAAWNTLASV